MLVVPVLFLKKSNPILEFGEWRTQEIEESMKMCYTRTPKSDVGHGSLEVIKKTIQRLRLNKRLDRRVTIYPVFVLENKFEKEKRLTGFII